VDEQKIPDSDFCNFLEKVLKPALEEIPRAFIDIRSLSEKKGKLTPHLVSKEKERVYCYELYHQLKLKLNKYFGKGMYLFGETDKTEYLELERKIPDFIIHEPGSNDNNFLAMEVKRINANPMDIGKDINKIEEFLTNPVLRYQFGCVLLFGKTYPNKEVLKKRIELMDLIKEKNIRDRFVLIIHSIEDKDSQEVLKVEVYQ
jgi:hypothetical protein